MRNLHLVARNRIDLLASEVGNDAFPRVWCAKSARSCGSGSFGDASIFSVAENVSSSVRLLDVEFKDGGVTFEVKNLLTDVESVNSKCF